ncbi:sulfatase [Rubritalea tangerina]|uniref:Sulfatase n=2 Tax=Rubritalea tangerina TaxID=430798 RepID=A0ABW4ZE02_9BACT
MTLKHLILLFLITSLSSAEQRPNIVFCIADDWGWPHASSYHDPVVKTPHFDHIAKQGVLFQHAYVSSPSCTPSRNAILTGKYHWSLGQGANLWSHFPQGEHTFPRILERAGYHVGSYRKAFGPGKDAKPPAAGKIYKSPDHFFTSLPPNQPFCFWFGTSDPHRSYKKGSGINSGMNPKKVRVPPVLPNTPEIQSDICDYYFEVQRFDSQVGDLLKLLANNDLLKNTIVIMTSDHGWPFPRGKSNLYDLGTRVPLAIMWPNAIKHTNRTFTDFVSLTDIAPTLLEAANISPPAPMHGRSLLPILQSNQLSDPQNKRASVITGKERHTPCQESGSQSAPCRAIRTHQFLYIHNFKPNRWPAGAPVGEKRSNYADIDDSPTKSFILKHKDDSKYSQFYQLACAKRPQDELYDLSNDPHQINNIAHKPQFQNTLKTLKNQLFEKLTTTGDLRMTNHGDQYENWPYLGRTQQSNTIERNGMNEWSE